MPVLNSYPDIRISIFDPTGQNLYCYDASGDIGRGTLQYTDTPDGCDAAKIPLILSYEAIYAKGYWQQYNIVEIHSGDCKLIVTAAALGAGSSQKYYIDSSYLFDPAYGEDGQVAYFYDGVNLTMRCPVTSVGVDSTGPNAGKGWIICTTPASGGGIPAYNATQTTVGRRRYAGRIMRRSRTNSKIADATIQCAGLKQSLHQALGNFTVGLATNTDVGAAIYSGFSLFTAQAPNQFPFLTIAAANFPNVGTIYAGSKTDSFLDSFISDCINAIPLDYWTVRIGHDLTPRLVKLYNGTAATYTYNVTLRQNVTTNYEALQVEVDDADGTTLFNRIKVAGNTDPTTKQPYSAIVQDTNSIAFFGYPIDGQPIQNQGLNSTLACAQYGQNQLNQNSQAKSQQKFRVYTTLPIIFAQDISYRPGNAQKGDIVRAIENVTIPDFTPQATSGTIVLTTEGGASLQIEGLTDTITSEAGALSITPPPISGIPSTVVTTVDFANLDSYQDVTFASILPPWSDALQERANAVAMALKTGSNVETGIDQYFIDQSGWPLPNGPSSSGLVVSPPSFKALFAVGTAPVVCGGNTFRLTANSTQFVWLNPNNTWTIVNNSAPVVGSIPYGFFTTSATAVLGATRLAALGLLSIPGSYFLNTPWTPSLTATSAVSTFAIPGLASSVALTCTVTNQPTDGSLARINFFYKKTGDPTYTGAMGVQAKPGASATYSVVIADLTAGVGYDFAMTGEGNSGQETSPATYIASTVAQTIVVGTPYLAGGASFAPTFSASPTITVTPSVNGVSASVEIQVSFTNQPTNQSLGTVAFFYTYANPGAGPFSTPAGFTPAGEFPAVGNGSASPPTTGAYQCDYIDLTNGAPVYFAAAYVDVRGELSQLVYLGTIVAQTLGIPQQYLIEGALVTPIVTGPSGSGAPTITAVKGQFTSQLSLKLECTNQPIDGSFANAIAYYRQSGQPDWLLIGASPPRQGTGAVMLHGSVSTVGLYTYTLPEASNSVTYEFGFAVQSIRGTESSVVSCGTYHLNIGVPPSISFTVTQSPALGNLDQSGGSSKSVSWSIAWSASGAGAADMSWLSYIVVYSYYYDPAFPGKSNAVSTVPSNGAGTSGSFPFGLTLAENDTGAPSGQQWRYGFYCAFVAVDGSFILQNTAGWVYLS